MPNMITITNQLNANDIKDSRIILRQKPNMGVYVLEVLNKNDWSVEHKKNDKAVIDNLGKIIEIMKDSQIQEADAKVQSEVITRLNDAAEKHNNRFSKYCCLKFLLIPWLLSKVFNWTLFDRYGAIDKTLMNSNSNPLENQNKLQNPSNVGGTDPLTSTTSATTITTPITQPTQQQSNNKPLVVEQPPIPNQNKQDQQLPNMQPQPVEPPPAQNKQDLQPAIVNIPPPIATKPAVPQQPNMQPPAVEQPPAQNKQDHQPAIVNIPPPVGTKPAVPQQPNMQPPVNQNKQDQQPAIVNIPPPVATKPATQQPPAQANNQQGAPVTATQRKPTAKPVIEKPVIKITDPKVQKMADLIDRMIVESNQIKGMEDKNSLTKFRDLYLDIKDVKSKKAFEMYLPNFASYINGFQLTKEFVEIYSDILREAMNQKISLIIYSSGYKSNTMFKELEKFPQLQKVIREVIQYDLIAAKDSLCKELEDLKATESTLFVLLTEKMPKADLDPIKWFYSIDEMIGPFVEELRKRPVDKAFEKGLALLTLMIDKGVSADKIHHAQSLLDWTTYNTQKDNKSGAQIADLLMSKGAKFDSSNTRSGFFRQTPEYFEVYRKYVPSITAIKTEEDSAIHHAAEERNLPLIKWLIEKYGFSLSTEGRNKRTAFHYYVSRALNLSQEDTIRQLFSLVKPEDYHKLMNSQPVVGTELYCDKTAAELLKEGSRLTREQLDNICFEIHPSLKPTETKKEEAHIVRTQELIDIIIVEAKGQRTDDKMEEIKKTKKYKTLLNFREDVKELSEKRLKEKYEKCDLPDTLCRIILEAYLTQKKMEAGCELLRLVVQKYKVEIKQGLYEEVSQKIESSFATSPADWKKQSVDPILDVLKELGAK